MTAHAFTHVPTMPFFFCKLVSKESRANEEVIFVASRCPE